MRGLTVGQKASAKRVFTAEDVAAYRALTGDVGLGFGDVGGETAPSTSLSASVPGPLLAGMFSDLLGTKLPGRGTNWLKQQLQFSVVVNVGEEVTATVEITRLRPEKDLVNLRTTGTTTTGVIICSGESLVWISDLELKHENQDKPKKSKGGEASETNKQVV